MDAIAKQQISVTIKVFGCPAEEQGSKENYMAQARFFEELDACLYHHGGPINV